MTDEQERRARELAERFWEKLLEAEPTLGTWIGDERYDDRLSDPGEAGRAERQDLFQGAMDELAGIDRAALTEELRTTLDVLETGARRELDSLRLRLDQLHAVSHMFGPTGLIASLGSVQRADTPERVDRYEARLRSFPAFLAATSEVGREGSPPAGPPRPSWSTGPSVRSSACWPSPPTNRRA